MKKKQTNKQTGFDGSGKKCPQKVSCNEILVLPKVLLLGGDCIMEVTKWAMQMWSLVVGNGAPE